MTTPRFIEENAIFSEYAFMKPNGVDRMKQAGQKTASDAIVFDSAAAMKKFQAVGSAILAIQKSEVDTVLATDKKPSTAKRKK